VCLPRTTTSSPLGRLSTELDHGPFTHIPLKIDLLHFSWAFRGRCEDPGVRGTRIRTPRLKAPGVGSAMDTAIMGWGWVPATTTRTFAIESDPQCDSHGRLLVGRLAIGRDNMRWTVDVYMDGHPLQWNFYVYHTHTPPPLGSSTFRGSRSVHAEVEAKQTHTFLSIGLKSISTDCMGRGSVQVDLGWIGDGMTDGFFHSRWPEPSDAAPEANSQVELLLGRPGMRKWSGMARCRATDRHRQLRGDSTERFLGLEVSRLLFVLWRSPSGFTFP